MLVQKEENNHEYGTKHHDHHQSEKCNCTYGEYTGDATGYGMDMPGMLASALTKAYELKACLTLVAAKTDSADPNLTTLNDVLASLT